MTSTHEKVRYAPDSKRPHHTAETAAQSVQDALAPLSGRWKLRILFELFGGRVRRFSELERSIEGISQKMLTQQLRQLEEGRGGRPRDLRRGAPACGVSTHRMGAGAVSSPRPAPALGRGREGETSRGPARSVRLDRVSRADPAMVGGLGGSPVAATAPGLRLEVAE